MYISNPTDITSARTTIHALRMLSKGGINDRTINDEDEGRNWDDYVHVVIRHDDKANEEGKACIRFNRMKTVPEQHRTHGRTSRVERDLIAYFSKYIPKRIIAEKFSVSLPTVYLHSKRSVVIV